MAWITTTRLSSVGSMKPWRVRTCCRGRQSCRPGGPGSSRDSLRSGIRSLAASGQSGSKSPLPSRRAPPHARHNPRRHTMDSHFAVAYAAIEQRRRVLVAERRSEQSVATQSPSLASMRRSLAPIRAGRPQFSPHRSFVYGPGSSPSCVRLHPTNRRVCTLRPLPPHASGTRARHAVPNIRSRINLRIQRSG